MQFGQKTNFLFKKVSPSSLGFIRLVTGIVSLITLHKFQRYVDEFIITQDFRMPYDGFEWIPVLSEDSFEMLFLFLYLTAILFTIGFIYRASSIFLFLGFTYIFLLDKAHYNNHYYLTCLLLFFFALVNGNKWGVIGKRKSDQTIPYWQIWIFRAQLFIVYFYGAIAKLDWDWLSGYPMKYWLYFSSTQFNNQTIQLFLQSDFAAFFFSWTGLLFDAIIGFMLFSKKWRRVSWIPLLFFHVSNHFLWQIGVFPWLMLLLTSIYFDPDWADKAWQRLQKNPSQFFLNLLSYMNPIKLWKWMNPWRENNPQEEVDNLGVRNKFLAAGLVVFFAFQLLFPFRQFLYKGDPSWTGEGHLFAWRMMLVDEADAYRIALIDPATKQKIFVDISMYLNTLQSFKIGRTPNSYIDLCHFIRDEIRVKGGIEEPELFMEVYKSVNYRSPQLLNDTTLNYAKIEKSIWKHSDWINDWSSSEEKPTFSKNEFDKWKKFIDDYNERMNL